MVSDVRKYHKFLFWCSETSIDPYTGTGEGDKLAADSMLVINFGVITGGTYDSKVTIDEPHLIESVGLSTGLLKVLVSTWKFNPCPKNITPVIELQRAV